MTVAITDPEIQVKEYKDSDFKIEWYSGTGAGGQNRNKVLNSCRITHIPSGIISTAQTRSRPSSLMIAKNSLIEKIKSADKIQQMSETSLNRKSQVGSGMRGDKIRTYRFQDDIATDHRTDRKYSVKKIMAGYFELFW